MATMGAESVACITLPAALGTVPASVAAITGIPDRLRRPGPVCCSTLPPQLLHGALYIVARIRGRGRGLPQLTNGCLYFTFDFLGTIPGRRCSRLQGIEVLQDSSRFGQQLLPQTLVLFIRHLSRLVVKIKFADLLQNGLFLRLQRFPPAHARLSRSMPREKRAHEDEAHDN